MKKKSSIAYAILFGSISILLAILTSIDLIEYKYGTWLILIPGVVYTLFFIILKRKDDDKKDENK